MYRRISAILIPALVAIAIMAFLVLQVWDSLPVLLQNFDPLFLPIALALCSAAWIVRGYRYRYILSGLGITASLRFSTASIFVSQTANLIVPARLGDLVRIFILKHEGLATYSRGLSSLVVERVFDIVMVAVLGFLAINFVFNVPGWAYTMVTIPIVGGGIFVLLLYLMGMITSENRYLAILLSIVTEVRQASLTLRAFSLLSLSSVLVWLLDILVCAAVLGMFRENAPFAAVVLGIAIGNLVKAVPLTPGGLGTYELALAGIISLAGIPFAAASLVAVIDHLIKNLVTLGGGAYSVYYFGEWVLGSIKSALRTKLGEDKGFGD